MKYPKIEIADESELVKSEIQVEASRLETMMPSKKRHGSLLSTESPHVEVRSDGQLNEKALWLDKAYDWVIVEDKAEQICLIAITKATSEQISLKDIEKDGNR